MAEPKNNQKQKNKAKSVGIRDLAQQMNVAVSTISRALSGDPGVSKARAKEIREYAKRVGYEPHPLRRKVKRAIGLVVASETSELLMDQYQKSIVFHMDRQASQLGLHLHVQFVPCQEPCDVWPSAIKDNRVDGVVLAGHPPADLCKRIAERGIPAVVLSDTFERTGCHCVSANPTAATTEGIQKLVELGHHHIAIATSDRKFPTVEQRYQAYYFGLFDAGIKPDPEWTIQGLESNIRGGRKAVQYFLKTKLPTAILCVNDWVALGAILELAENGLHVPKDVSIMGFDNDPICQELSKPLTTADIKLQETVTLALERLQQQQDGKLASPGNDQIPCELIWRETCGPPRKS